MAIRDVVTRGYGSWETDSSKIPPRGYTPATVAAVTLLATGRLGAGDTAKRNATGDSTSRAGSGDTTKRSAGIG